jgi:poly-gamma-glutamate synthesis protein (capsule biosynthesis protein)
MIAAGAGHRIGGGCGSGVARTTEAQRAPGGEDEAVMGRAADEVAIGLLGDTMLGRGVGWELQFREAAELWDPELRALAASLDAIMCNLECCVSLRGTPTSLIPGKPFFFRAPPAAVGALEAIGVRAVTLANNHALDFGACGLADTVTALAAAGIAAAGAGPDCRAARHAAVVQAAGRRVAVVAATDHPVEYAATPSGWGVAYADLRQGPPEWLVREIGAAHEQCDLVIASPHWGPNMTVGPAEWQRRAASALQDAGADLVAGHSAHLFHGVGWTRAGPILYDLGEALDDYRVDPELRNDLGILAIWRPGSASAQLELVGLRLEYARTALAVDADAEWIAARLQRACSEHGTCVTRIAEQRFRVEPA